MIKSKNYAEKMSWFNCYYYMAYLLKESIDLKNIYLTQISRNESDEIIQSCDDRKDI